MNQTFESTFESFSETLSESQTETDLSCSLVDFFQYSLFALNDCNQVIYHFYGLKA